MPHRISKREFDQRGGLSAPRLWRRQQRSGRWIYYEAL
jgi:hypothetical protein